MKCWVVFSTYFGKEKVTDEEKIKMDQNGSMTGQENKIWCVEGQFAEKRSDSL